MEIKIEEQLVKSLIQIRNNTGPSTEPCGTPHVFLQWIWIWLFTEINCCLLVKYERNHSFGKPKKPNPINIGLLQAKYAFRKSDYVQNWFKGMGTEIHWNVKAKNFSTILTTIAVSKSHPGRPACKLRTAKFSFLFAWPYEHTLFIIIAVRWAVVQTCSI